jgi:hypothetical protein
VIHKKRKVWVSLLTHDTLKTLLTNPKTKACFFIYTAVRYLYYSRIEDGGMDYILVTMSDASGEDKLAEKNCQSGLQ